jgi:hypothetical protein
LKTRSRYSQLPVVASFVNFVVLIGYSENL